MFLFNPRWSSPEKTHELGTRTRRGAGAPGIATNGAIGRSGAGASPPFRLKSPRWVGRRGLGLAKLPLFDPSPGGAGEARGRGEDHILLTCVDLEAIALGLEVLGFRIQIVQNPPEIRVYPTLRFVHPIRIAL